VRYSPTRGELAGICVLVYDVGAHNHKGFTSMKQTYKTLLTASLSLALVLTPATVFAHEGEHTADDPDAPTHSEVQNRNTIHEQEKRSMDAAKRLREELEAKRADRKEQVQTARAELKERLEGAKKRACERHQTKINNLMERMDERRQKAFDRITQVYTAVDAFVAEKSLTVEDYNALVATVNAAKTIAQDTLKEQVAVPELNCDGEQPRADVTEFREKRLNSIDAMKAYRSAVKEFANAVKTAAQEATTETEEGES